MRNIILGILIGGLCMLGSVALYSAISGAKADGGSQSTTQQCYNPCATIFCVAQSTTTPQIIYKDRVVEKPVVKEVIKEVPIIKEKVIVKEVVKEVVKIKEVEKEVKKVKEPKKDKKVCGAEHKHKSKGYK